MFVSDYDQRAANDILNLPSEVVLKRHEMTEEELEGLGEEYDHDLDWAKMKL